ncbi:ABC transporter permease, partial [candidate division KSB1 bacterium]
MTGNAKNKKPPKIAESILKRLLPDTGWDTPLGDFEEDFNEMAVKKGNIRAVIWYFLQIIKIIPGRILNSMKWNNAMLKNYLKISMRNLIRQKVYSGINISGLAVGLASCILIFLWIRDEISYDRFHTNSDRLYRTRVEQEGHWWSGSPWAFVPLLKNNYPDVEKATRVAILNVVLKYQDKSDYFQGVYVDRDFFDMFTFPLIKGDPDAVFQSKNEIVLTEEKAVLLFGDEDPIGKIVYTNNQDLTVTGIIQDPPENSTIQFSFLA